MPVDTAVQNSSRGKGAAFEKNGIIFVVQTDLEDATEETLLGLPEVLNSDQIIFHESEAIIEANWKLHLESFLEGYHIKPAHKDTFFPFGYDNLNVIEFCGPHSRVTFPFRRIETLSDMEPDAYDVSDKLTYVTHLFPNVVLAELSHHLSLGILEPLSVDRTRVTTYHMTRSLAGKDKESVIETAKRDLEFVNGTGQKEDIEMVTGIQKGVRSGANDVFTFGKFEPAIIHFHKHMARKIDVV